jgi:hypothetical protein
MNLRGHIIPEEEKKITEEWIRVHPTASHTEYMVEMKDKAPCSDCHYYEVRRQVTGKARPSNPPEIENSDKRGRHILDRRKSRFSNEDRKILVNYIKNHPDATHGQYMQDLGKKVPCSDVTYYSWRKKNNGAGSERVKRSYNRVSHSLYNTIWTYPVEKLVDPREVLADFIDKLNGMKRAHMEIIELKMPAVLEVRETSR